MFGTALRPLAFALLALPLALAPISPAVAQGGYRLQPGDTVQIEVLEDPALNRSALVLPDGSISFPQAGTLQAGGRTVDQLRGALTSALAPNFAATPNVYVSVGALAVPREPRESRAETMDVYVLGEVEAPGRREVKPKTTLLQFLAEAGPMTRFVARHRIELHRTDARSGVAQVYLFDLDNVAGGQGRINGMTQLGEGDVLVLPQRRLFE